MTLKETLIDPVVRAVVERYQCTGCVCGGNIDCYEKGDDLACHKHVAGTNIAPHVWRIFLGMPKGFCRIASSKDMKINIFENPQSGWRYGVFNVPVWKYFDSHGNTLVRGMLPRINCTFLHVFIGNHIDMINCIEITTSDIDKMD